MHDREDDTDKTTAITADKDKCIVQSSQDFLAQTECHHFFKNPSINGRTRRYKQRAHIDIDSFLR